MEQITAEIRYDLEASSELGNEFAFCVSRGVVPYIAMDVPYQNRPDQDVLLTISRTVFTALRPDMEFLPNYMGVHDDFFRVIIVQQAIGEKFEYVVNAVINGDEIGLLEKFKPIQQSSTKQGFINLWNLYVHDLDVSCALSWEEIDVIAGYFSDGEPLNSTRSKKDLYNALFARKYSVPVSEGAIRYFIRIWEDARIKEYNSARAKVNWSESVAIRKIDVLGRLRETWFEGDGTPRKKGALAIVAVKKP